MDLKQERIPVMGPTGQITAYGTLILAPSTPVLAVKMNDERIKIQIRPFSPMPWSPVQSHPPTTMTRLV